MLPLTTSSEEKCCATIQITAVKLAVYQVTFSFFFQAEQAVLQLVSFLYNFLPENDQHVSSHLDGGMAVYMFFLVASLQN